MALNLDDLRAAVNEKKIEEPAFSEEDLETEKNRLRAEIAEQQKLSDGSTRTVDGLISLNEMALQNSIERLAELEAGGLAAMRTREQQEELVVEGFKASLIDKYGKLPKFDDEGNRVE